MLKVNKLSEEELNDLGDLLKSDQLCFNDINEDGVHLFNVKFNEEVIGYFGFELFTDQALFRSMVVVPGARGKGYGKLIWQQAKLRLTEIAVKDVYLLTNSAAAFFSKQGFIEIKRDSVPTTIAGTTEFKEFCPSDSICMKFNLKE